MFLWGAFHKIALLIGKNRRRLTLLIAIKAGRSLVSVALKAGDWVATKIRSATRSAFAWRSKEHNKDGKKHASAVSKARR